MCHALFNSHICTLIRFPCVTLVIKPSPGPRLTRLSVLFVQQAIDTEDWSLSREAETLLVPFVVSLINLVVPLFYSLFNKFELYSSQRMQIYALILRWDLRAHR